MTLQEARLWARETLTGAGVENAAREADWLLEAVTGIEAAQFISQQETPVSMEQDVELCAYVARRVRREPLQYILGEAPFYRRMFKVRPGVLIPRLDTELLCEEALARLPAARRVLEICCGSAAVAITLALEGTAEVFAGEISEDALAVARENIARYHARVELRRSDLFTAFAGSWYDLIVCNPPYIATADLATLMPEVRDYEPPLALDGGADGLNVYRRIIPQAMEMLHPNGTLLLEIGHTQEKAVTNLMRERGYQQVITKHDLSGHPRVIGGTKV